MSDANQSGQDNKGGGIPAEVLSGRFAQMVLQQVNMTMLLLGKMAHPQTGEFARDIDAARMFIDQLEMIEAKTKGNLNKEEEALLKQSLLSLHMAFVEAVESPAPSRPETPPAQPDHAAPAAGGPVPPNPTDETDARTKFSKKY
jgi:hypothetical protein